MWHLLHKTNGYRHTIIGPINGFTYGGNPLENAVPSTYDSHSTVNNCNNRLKANPYRRYCHSAGNLFSRRKSAVTGMFHKHPNVTLRHRHTLPDSAGLPPGLHPNVRTHVCPERAGIPRLKGSCHSSLGSSGDISISHSGVTRVSLECSTNVLTSLYVIARFFRNLPASLPDSYATNIPANTKTL